jgi:hypothetical protein
MKSFGLSFVVLLLVLELPAQGLKYAEKMKENLLAMDTVHTASGLQALSGSFVLIADSEKRNWLPLYYAALAWVNSGYMLYEEAGESADFKKLAAQLDPVADKAEQLLNRSEALSMNNSEIFAVRSMIATLRLIGNPITRAMKYGPVADKALQTAKKLNPENPRVYLLMGIDKFQTPKLFGGSQEKARDLFKQALRKFDALKPSDGLEPRWGRKDAESYLSQIKL